MPRDQGIPWLDREVAIHASPAGGTQEQAIEPERQEQPALTDAQVVRLAQLGRQIEAHFGRPKDIEWCLVDDGFQIVQSRPITTLFPIPEVGDRANHVYVSVGHQQMMTEPMKPLGLSLWQLTALRPMYEAGGRLPVDVTQDLASPASRAGLLEVMGKGDPLIRDALETILDCGDFIPSLPDQGPGSAKAGGGLMTHGAVIAREYGLPAVVGVEHATQLIQDGQRIRVHGTDGYVEFLPSPGQP